MNNSLSEKFNQIYDEYIEKIYRFVYVKVNAQETAQDITSKVFLKTWEAYQNSPDSIENMRAFLYQTARNMVIDHYRQKDKKGTISTEGLPEFPSRTDLHQKAVLASDMEGVMTAIRNLKQEYQDILIWHYLDDLSIEEISGILDKSHGAVRVTLHRGLSALRNILKN